jgi:hypothetical protein
MVMNAPSGFDAFGHPVPVQRQVAALDTAAEQIGISDMLADPVIREASRYIEPDQPDKALIVLRNITDLTGAYWLLAVLCAEPLVPFPAPAEHRR